MEGFSSRLSFDLQAYFTTPSQEDREVIEAARAIRLFVFWVFTEELSSVRKFLNVQTQSRTQFADDQHQDFIGEDMGLLATSREAPDFQDADLNDYVSNIWMQV